MINNQQTLQESQRWYQFLLLLSDTLRPLSDATQIQAAAARVLAEHLGADRAYYVAVDETSQIATMTHSASSATIVWLISVPPLTSIGPGIRR